MTMIKTETEKLLQKNKKFHFNSWTFTKKTIYHIAIILKELSQYLIFIESTLLWQPYFGKICDLKKKCKKRSILV